LPSNAELNYAASGGAEQRKYPWGQTEPGASADLAIYDCHYNGSGPDSCTGVTNIAPVGSVPAGNGKYGHADLAGNVWEWTLDEETAPHASCDDCASLPYAPVNNTIRGGGFHNEAFSILAAGSNWGETASRSGGVGVRCARAP